MHDIRLTIAAERVDESRDRQRNYHRSFRFPKDVDVDGLSAEYRNDVLEILLPVATDPALEKGTAIPIES